jgi:hypothetical protein
MAEGAAGTGGQGRGRQEQKKQDDYKGLMAAHT